MTIVGIILVLLSLRCACFLMPKIPTPKIPKIPNLPGLPSAMTTPIPYVSTTDTTNILYEDRLIGEAVYFTCYLEGADFKFESYAFPIVQKVISETDEQRTTYIRTFDHLTLKISLLKPEDSGTYGCETKDEINQNVLKLAVHDPKLFTWTFSDRGMTPMRYIELGRWRAILKWKDWMTCDGCAGYGERRRLGFCYITVQKKLYQCLDYRHLRMDIRAIAKRKRNEIVVETCYDACDDDENIFKPASKLSLLVETGDSLDLNCPGNVSIRSSVRWELQFNSLLRKEYSFGYGPAKDYYVTRTNGLQINNINFRNELRITVTCVLWRQERHVFELNLMPETDKITETIEHLRMMVLSCSVQFAVFLVLVLVLDSTEAFAESVSLKQNL